MYMKRMFFIVELTLLFSALFLSVTSTAPVADTRLPGDLDPIQVRGSPYELTATFYSFFDYGGWSQSEINDVWLARELSGDYKMISGDVLRGQPAYPVYYIWYDDGFKAQEAWYYTCARLNITGRSLQYIWIDDPEFLPQDLLGNLEGGVTGGTTSISWYMQYFDEARAEVLDDIYNPPGPSLPNSYDGWLIEWNGTITMDENATKKILGITEAEYNSLIADPADWWSTNEAAVESAWDSWLDYEGNTRLDIYCFYEYWWSSIIWDLGDPAPIPSYNSSSGLLTMTLESVSWGMEYLMARWLREANVLESYEYYFSDFSMNATISPSTTDLDIDMAVEFFSYFWGEKDLVTKDDNYPQTSTLGWEGLLGDSVVKNPHPSDFEPYVGKTYFNSGPNQGYDNKYNYNWRHGDWADFDYTPAAWNLKAGETLNFNFSNTWDRYLADPTSLWIFTQLTWDTATQNPNDTMRTDHGFLQLGYVEPWPETLSAGVFSYGNTTKTLTFTGPFNMTAWSETYLWNEWNGIHSRYGLHPEGSWDPPLLPWGCPLIMFRVSRGVGDVTGDGVVNDYDLNKIQNHLFVTSESTGRGHSNYNSQADIAPYVYGDGFVNIWDFLEVRDHLGLVYQ